MIRFADLPIRIKLWVLFASTAFSALLVACGGVWIAEAVTYRSALVRDTTAIAALIGQNSTAAISFNDEQAAIEMLGGLRAEPRIERACIYTRTGRVLAEYAASHQVDSCPSPQLAARTTFTVRDLLIDQPIALDGETIGLLHLRVSLDDLYARMARFGLILAALLSGAALVALLLFSRLQRLISAPILHLTDVAARVSRDKDYSIRASSGSRDELGVLITQFNSMMEEVNKRDEQLRDHREMLERRVDERTRALSAEIAERKIIEQDLIRARAAAEASNRAKSEFLANMSHELRTPLTSIIGYSELLGEDAAADNNSALGDDLRRIESAGRHLLSLVNDILDLSKIEAGRMDMSLDWVTTSALLAQVSGTIDTLARKRNNRFIIDATRAPAALFTDAQRLYQILINLLSNACKFTEEGTISIVIDSVELDGRPATVWTISDTGIGINADDLKKLFRPFSQVDATATRKYGGTGLGLDISQRLCRMLGGTITVASQPGVGSTFTVTLPATPPGATPPA